CVESVKAVEDLNAPITGTVIDRNEEILESPERLSEEDPYIEGWLMKVRVKDPDELEGDDIYSAEEYREMVEGE
ncbi:MAG: glycine cleavage system protein H, partial [Okeania sp. SIO2B9]|nr:glycine cleavage system protein H [Okeania sp. SIO2B9]